MTAPTWNSDHPDLLALRDWLRAMYEGEGEVATDAEIRAALRELPPRDLLELANVLGDIADLVARVRSGAVRQARMQGASVAAAADAMELSERRLLASHPIPVVEYTPLPPGDLLALHEVPTGSRTPQPVLLELAVPTGELTVLPAPDRLPDSHPQGVETGLLLRWTVPLLTPRGANALLREVKPLARRVCFGTDLDQDKAGRPRAHPDADARQAAREIAELCAQAVETYEHLVQIEARDYFPVSDERALREYGLDAASTDAQVRAAAERAERRALGDRQILRGAAEHLARAVEEAQVDTDLVLAVVQGPRPGLAAYADLAADGQHPGLDAPEITAWAGAQDLLLHEGAQRWIALSFAPIAHALASEVFTLTDEDARALARALAAQNGDAPSLAPAPGPRRPAG